MALGNRKTKERVAKGGMGKSQAEELFAEAQKMAQLRYKSYIRKTQENCSAE